MAEYRWLDASDPEVAPTRESSRSFDRLSAAQLSDPERIGERDEVLRLLEAHGEALADRTTAPGHLTGSALVVDARGERMLLILHTKLRRWLQPGGHADGDHDLAGVALKEASEETGIEGLRVLVPAVDIDIHEVDHGDALGLHLHLDVRFVVAAPDDAVVRGNHESLDQRWVTLEELTELADEEGIIRLAEAGLAALRAAPPPFS